MTDEGRPLKTIEDVMLNKAEVHLIMVESAAWQPLGLYVRKDEYPYEALRKIRSFLYLSLDDEREDIALVVACIDRVIERLAHAEVIWREQ